jgi:mannosyltransferase
VTARGIPSPRRGGATLDGTTPAPTATVGAPAAAARDTGSIAAGRRWGPLLALTLLAAALRLSTIDLQSLWYDEAFTPVHVLHATLGATLRAVVHRENTPPLWYVLEWGVVRAFGDGAVALRTLSALAGIATVPVVWCASRELAGRRAAIVAAALIATSPLFVWYSQEARAYALFALVASLALLCFVRALHHPTLGRVSLFALAASLALLTHYFAIFLVLPMVAWLAWKALQGILQGDRTPRERTIDPPHHSRTLLVLALPLVVGAALIPLVLAQGGHGTQWIGEWALDSRLEAIPQYYLTGYTGAALGHGIESLVALVLLAGVLHGLWRALTPREERATLIALVLAAGGVLTPIALALLGADYLAPRNLLAAMVPATVLIAIVIAARRAGRTGMAFAAALALALLALTIDVDLSPRLQRGDWARVAAVLRPAPATRAITTVELGAAPLEYYLPPLRNLAPGAHTTVTEIDETGYAPLRRSAGRPPAPGFHLLERRQIHGLIVYRFTSAVPVTISQRTLREHTITLAPHPEVLVPVSSGKTT